MPAEVALQLLGLSVPLGAALAFSARGRARGVSTAGWFGRTLMAALAALLVFLVPFATFACACGVGNNPLRQVIMPAAGAFLVALLVDGTRKRVLAVALLLAWALCLAGHFHVVVLPSDKTACRFTGDPAFVQNSCEHSVTAARAWYTPWSGLYPLQPR